MPAVMQITGGSDQNLLDSCGPPSHHELNITSPFFPASLEYYYVSVFVYVDIIGHRT